MNAIIDLIKSFGKVFVWWTVLQPWELGIRVRLGKHRKRLSPGLWFRIPYIDAVYRQSVRLRFTTLRQQTVTTKDNYTITLSGVLGYTIFDLDTLYDALHQAEDGIRSLAQGAISNYIHSNNLINCSPEDVQKGAEQRIDLNKYGLKLQSVTIINYAKVKTYRFMMDKNDEGIWEDLLNTRLGD